MQVKMWGTRGSIATPGPETARYGGNTSCAQVTGREGTVLVLDAGSGIRRMPAGLAPNVKRVDVLLTHLHMDHILGLGFFGPLYNPGMEVHIWGPASTTLDLRTRLNRYLSPPLFPVHLRDLPCKLALHDVPRADFDIGEFLISATTVCHPGPTVGYRIASGPTVMAYMPDHEPALGVTSFPMRREWTSGFPVAQGVDLLLHDTQYTDSEYADRVGWGHSTFQQSIRFAELCGAKRLVAVHHDPTHSDTDLDEMISLAIAAAQPKFPVVGAQEGVVFNLGPDANPPRPLIGP